MFPRGASWRKREIGISVLLLLLLCYHVEILFVLTNLVQAVIRIQSDILQCNLPDPPRWQLDIVAKEGRL